MNNSVVFIIFLLVQLWLVGNFPFPTPLLHWAASLVCWLHIPCIGLNQLGGQLQPNQSIVLLPLGALLGVTLVLLDVVLPCEALVALGAAEGEVIGVELHMLHHVGFAAECLGAVEALEGLDVGVGDDMSLELICSIKGHLTSSHRLEGTLELLVGFMDQHVSLEFVFAVEVHAAHQASERLLPRVDQDVRPQIVFTLELLVAEVALVH